MASGAEAGATSAGGSVSVRSAPQGSLKPGRVSVWAIGSASSIGEHRGPPDIHDLGASWQRGSVRCSWLVVPVGSRRWYRRALRRSGLPWPRWMRREPADHGPGPTDTLGRAMRDLRISVTDRCNFRCTYCMPKEIFGRDYAFLPKDQVLSFEEIERIARIFVALGVDKLRITGGEPLVRRDLPDLIAMLAAIRRPDGGEVDLTLTTNGSALRALAGAAQGSRPAAGDGQPRFARRRGLRRDERDRLPGRARPRRDRRRDRGRPGSGQDQHGRPPRRERDEHRADGALGARDRRDPPVHRVHGRRPLERLAARRGRAGRGDRRRHRGRLAGRGRGRRPTAARSPTAGDTPTVSASSGSSRRSPSPSAATARARGSRPRASSTPACSRSTGTTCGALLRSEMSDADLTEAIASIWLRRGDRYSELRSAATRDLPRIEMFAMGG